MSSNADQVRQNIQQLMQQYGVNYSGSGTPDFSKIDPAVMKQILQMNVTKEQQDQLNLQLRLAQMQQDSSMGQRSNEGAAVPRGAQYIPPNAGAVALNMYSHLRGIIDSASGKDQQSVLNKKLSDALDSWSNVLQGRDSQGNPSITSTIPKPQLQDTTFDPNSTGTPTL